MKCENCNEEHDGLYGSGRFCSTKCARGFATKNNRKEINEKVSKKLKEKELSSKKEIDCLECGNKIVVSVKNVYQNNTKKFCSRKCKTLYNSKHGYLSRYGRKGGLKSAKMQQRRSKNEIYFADLCKQHFKSVLTNEPIFNGWDADIILENEKIAILWNGPWHYVEGITKEHKLKQVQNRDKIKLKEIILAGYTPYVIKDMGKENKEFVEKQFETFLNFIMPL